MICNITLNIFCNHLQNGFKTRKVYDMKIGIIGAGAAGLAALRHSRDAHHDCEIFEKTGLIGGTWNYTDRTGKDEFGLPIHTAMYKGLRTNIPKEIMQFEDFAFQTPEDSYVKQSDVLKYINDFATHFNLLPHIKFFKNITKICPLEKGRWSVEVRDLKLKSLEIKEFDAIFVCVGNYSVPSMPTFPGIENFQGTAIHSCCFRNADNFKNRKVLIVGSGPSGRDIATLIQEVSENVILCHRSPLNPKDMIPTNIKKKPEIQKFKEHSVVFKDGSEEIIDDVIFCTGYLYSYPFLSNDCEIKIENRWVKYLYKQVININHPTMAFIGVPFGIFPFVIFGVQIRFFLAYLAGKLLKSKEKMMEDLLIYMNKRKELGIPDSKAHFLGVTQGEYMDDLAETANIKKVPDVFIKIYKYVHGEGKGNRNLSFKIINNNEFKIVNQNAELL